MTIPFIRHFPDGHKSVQEIPRSPSVEKIARRFLATGGRYYSEVTDSGDVKLSAIKMRDGEPWEVEREISDNGPELTQAVDRLVLASEKHIERTQ